MEVEGMKKIINKISSTEINEVLEENERQCNQSPNSINEGLKDNSKKTCWI